jgi:hypothetical protein
MEATICSHRPTTFHTTSLKMGTNKALIAAFGVTRPLRHSLTDLDIVRLMGGVKLSLFLILVAVR